LNKRKNKQKEKKIKQKTEKEKKRKEKRKAKNVKWARPNTRPGCAATRIGTDLVGV
jgi:F0F1-type ATP synthase assembly protein I